MKKFILICLFFTFLCANLFAQQEVTLEEIKTAGAHYLSAYNPDRTLYNVSDISSVSYITHQRKPAIYEVLFQNGNTVLLSGSKACIPILGCNFSKKGESIVDNDDLPPGLQAMLDGMLIDIDSALLNDTITLYYQAEWDELISTDFLNNRNVATQHGPLLTSIWGQRYSNDYWNSDPHAYNYYVTKTSSSCDDDYCPAGCVAVAMAQVLYYWKHPWDRGVYTYFDWCNMPDSLWKTNNPRYETERNAVAQLIYDCAELIDTKYCNGGCKSSASSSTARDVLVTSFLCHKDANYRRRIFWLGLDKQWKKFIKDDIDRNRPVIYGGQKDRNGHTFVCDGYKDGDLFHFNWGWRGKFNELWLTVDNITPGEHNYNNLQDAIFEIHPDMSYFVNYCNAQVNLPAIYAVCMANGVYDYWNIVPHTGKILESCDESLPAAWRTIPSGESSVYTAFERVVLKPGFTAQAGSHFVASIRECPNCGKGYSSMLSVNIGEDTEDINYFNNYETLYSEKNLQVETDDDDVSIYPNPTSGTVTIVAANFARVEIYNTIGQLVETKTVEKFDVSTYSVGVYFFKVYDTNNNSVTKRVMVAK